MKKSMLVVAVAAALAAPALTGCTIKAGGAANAGSPPPPPPPATTEPAPAPTPTTEPAPAPAPATPPKVNASTGQVEIPGNVVFDTGAATLKEGGGSEVVLEQVVQFMKDNPKVTKLRVEGHTDNVGQAADNEKLSGERALTVKRWLVEKGVDAARLRRPKRARRRTPACSTKSPRTAGSRSSVVPTPAAARSSSKPFAASTRRAVPEQERPVVRLCSSNDADRIVLSLQCFERECGCRAVTRRGRPPRSSGES